MLTKKHFKEIANLFVAEREYQKDHVELGPIAIDGLALRMTSWLAYQNPRFNRAKFLAACGLEENKNGN